MLVASPRWIIDLEEEHYWTAINHETVRTSAPATFRTKAWLYVVERAGTMVPGVCPAKTWGSPANAVPPLPFTAKTVCAYAVLSSYPSRSLF